MQYYLLAELNSKDPIPLEVWQWIIPIAFLIGWIDATRKRRK